MLINGERLLPRLPGSGETFMDKCELFYTKPTYSQDKKNIRNKETVSLQSYPQVMNSC